MAKNRDESWKRKRAAIRQEYMELALYPDQYRGPESERNERLGELSKLIKKFRYKSIRNFINEIFQDSMNGMVDEDPTKAILRYLRGYRDKIEWECIAKAHQLKVNGEDSPWVATNQTAEVAGYIAFYINPRKCRIVRAFDVTKYRVLE